MFVLTSEVQVYSRLKLGIFPKESRLFAPDPAPPVESIAKETGEGGGAGGRSNFDFVDEVELELEVVDEVEDDGPKAREMFWVKSGDICIVVIVAILRIE